MPQEERRLLRGLTLRPSDGEYHGQTMGSTESELEALPFIPADGGGFEVKGDGDPAFSKKALGRHAEGGDSTVDLG